MRACLFYAESEQTANSTIFENLQVLLIIEEQDCKVKKDFVLKRTNLR